MSDSLCAAGTAIAVKINYTPMGKNPAHIIMEANSRTINTQSCPDNNLGNRTC